ncbi:hypothetical protein QP919_00435 [Corynebacterium propinquum]|uniref:Uncharacterized protein n=1 Tax=Corynebacterium propinquum TaxID=43769 RepID=A0AAP4FA24_9CORY|nr:DUF6541 family protein [Corynebacterium propinquum]MDK4258735.1 hypothetical protein [Corynebacterium propinquum]MDK4282250.1 hypothetical protein [Corynebacterium propinquum]MDK4299419.1 hypothetical protein [Corynebacterium propinquum]MDK4303514.1 hypothetical protein [Corynebacterium propinquum]MDK4324986.1 hypothetical protein [Corynebacterium propinquum]
MAAAIFAVSLLAVVILPGLLVGWRARLSMPVALMAAPAVTFGIVAAGVQISHVFGAGWRVPTAAVTLLVAVVLAELWGRLVPKPATQTRRWEAKDWLPVAGVSAGTLTIGGMYWNYLAAMPHGINNIFQGWDAHWHANVLAFISEEGIAAPGAMGALHHQFTDAPMYYPTAWHSVVSIPAHWVDLTTMAEYNLGSGIMLALVTPWAVAALASMLGGRAVAGIAGAGTAFFPALPWIEIRVAAIPAATSMMLGAMAAVLTIHCLRDRRAIPFAILALFGALSSQPQGLLVAVFLVLFYWVFHALFTPTRSRLGDFLTLAAVGLGAVATAIPAAVFLFGNEDAEDFGDFARTFEVPGIDRAESWRLAAGLLTRHTNEFGHTWHLLLIGGIGALVLLARKTVWPILLWGFGVALSAHAMKYFETPVGDFLQNLVGPFYSDARRINVWVSLLVAATSALALGWIIHTVAAAINKDRIRKLPVTVGVTSVVIAIVAGTALVTLQEPARRLSQDSRSGRLVSERDQRAYDWLAQQPKAYDGHVFVNPDEGNGWMYAYNRLPSTSRHYYFTGAVEPELTTLFHHLDEAGSGTATGEDVDRILERMDINYVFISPPNFWGPHLQPPNDVLLNLRDTAPGLTEVYRNHEVSIYAVDEMFSDAELDKILSDSPYPPQTQ